MEFEQGQGDRIPMAATASGVHIPREISRSEGPLRARFATVQCVIMDHG
jgi:hypothetical protein